jgi:hypothetical protein
MRTKRSSSFLSSSVRIELVLVGDGDRRGQCRLAEGMIQKSQIGAEGECYNLDDVAAELGCWVSLRDGDLQGSSGKI